MKTFHVTRKVFIAIGILIVGLIMANLIAQNYLLSAKVELLKDAIKLIIEEYQIPDSTIKQYIKETNPALPEHRVAEISRHIIISARNNDIDPFILTSLAGVESTFVLSAVSPAHARGLCQLQPDTFKDVSNGDINSLPDNVEAGARYLRKMLQCFGDVRLALAAYNCGPCRSTGEILRISGRYASRVLNGQEKLENRRKELAQCYYSDPMPISKAGKLFVSSPPKLMSIISLNSLQKPVKLD